VAKIFFCIALMMIAVLAPRPVSAEVVVRIDESGGIVVPVIIDGSGPFSFLLDTGSTHSVVSQSLADRLALHVVAKTSVSTSAGREWRPVVEMNQTTIESARSARLLASVATRAQLDAVARGIDGIIGQDFLFALNYTLDYRRKRLAWNDGASNAAGVRLPLVMQGGRYLVRVTSSSDESPLLLVPDSGASGFVAYERNGSTKLSLGPAAGSITVHSLSGAQSARTMMLRELRFGTVRIRNQPVAVVTRDPEDLVEGDGLLPLHLFASVTFNAREQCLVLRR
jgi:predicted aspartyl protease